MREFRLHTLDNGLKIVHLDAPTDIDYCGVAIRAGSRDELPGEEGLAHFVEHTIFKGTSRRRAVHILNRMESVGGELNAYTTKEETYVYTAAPAGHASRALELIADLISSSIFPAKELDKEREVILDEIDSCLDTPSEAVYDRFEDMIFANSSLGHNILGSPKTVSRFTADDCLRFVRRLYRPDRMVLFHYGAARFDTIVRLAERHFGSLTPSATAACDRPTEPASTAAPFDVDQPTFNCHQAHTIIGAVTPSLYSNGRHALALMNNILGGPGMNSRLNVALRERRGLVYTVESSLALYTDTGVQTIYFGCNPDDTDRCRRLVTTEIRRLVDEPLSPRTLDGAKRQYLGQMTLSAASGEQLILASARAVLFHGQLLGSRRVAEIIRSVTATDLQNAALHLLHPSRLTIQ